jgi:hypothetical protein
LSSSRLLSGSDRVGRLGLAVGRWYRSTGLVTRRLSSTGYDVDLEMKRYDIRAAAET